MPPAEPPPASTWPRPLSATLLVIFVILDGLLWMAGFYYLMAMDMEQETAVWQHDLSIGLQFLTAALVLMLLAGWAWRWWVARGWIGGRPTIRFGGS